MNLRAIAVSVVTLVLAACGGSGTAAPPGLAYGLPTPTNAVYLTGDTITMDVDAGGQALQMNVTVASTMGASFARAPGGVEVTLQVRDLKADMSNPMGATSADGRGISGPMVVRLDRRGAATVVSLPQVPDEVATFFQPLAIAHEFFPRLPGRAVEVGESWTDTIRYEGSQGPGSVSTTTVVTYTVEGNTEVNGRSLVKLALEGTSRSVAAGVTMGMDFRQEVAGSQSGWVLWDPQRLLMVECYAVSEGFGSMTVTAAPFPMGLKVTGRSHVRLQEGS